MNNDDNVCRAYFCMMPVEGVLVEGRMPVKAGEGGKGKIGAGGAII